jgi:hypothetical protein
MGPSFFISAGARFTVILLTGYCKLAFLIAERTRSLLSDTAVSGSPTISKRGNPPDMSASTSTLYASIPNRPRLIILENKISHPDVFDLM